MPDRGERGSEDVQIIRKSSCLTGDKLVPMGTVGTRAHRRNFQTCRLLTKTLANRTKDFAKSGQDKE